MSGNRFLVLSVWLAAFWFNNGQNQAQASAILQDDVNILKTQLTQLVQRLDRQERRNLQLEEKLQQQKEEFSTQLQQQKEEFSTQLQQQKEEFSTQLQQQKVEFSSQYQQQKVEFSTQFQQQKEEFSTQFQQQKEEFASQLQQQKDDFAFQLQRQSKVNEQRWEDLQNQKEDLQRKLQQQEEALITLLVKQTKPAGVQRKSGADRKSLDRNTNNPPATSKTEAPVRNNTLYKRSDDQILEPVVSHLTQQVTEMTAEIQSLKNVNMQQDTHITAATSTSYIRWGHASCPASAELIYSGIIGGSLYTAPGGPANHLCLTTQPVYDGHIIPSGHPLSDVYGSEYDICPETECELTPACAGCKILRTTTIMIPGTNVCPSGWTVEYSGHVMAGYSGCSEYLCVDSTLGYYHSSNTNDNQNTLHYVVSKCGALPCPPYADEKILICVVCSK